jgi:hypothetical protein
MQIPDVTVAEMSAAQLKELILSAVREALQEFFGDADADAELRPGLEEKLRQAVAHIASGERPSAIDRLTDSPGSASYAETLFSNGTEA